MEMNVSTQEEQLVAKKSGGLNPAIVLPILLAIGVPSSTINEYTDICFGANLNTFSKLSFKSIIL